MNDADTTREPRQHGGGEKHPQGGPKNPVLFVPDDLVLLVEHHQEMQAQEIIDKLYQNPIWQNKGFRSLSIPPERVLSFRQPPYGDMEHDNAPDETPILPRRARGQARVFRRHAARREFFSLVFAQVETRRAPRALVALINQINEGINDDSQDDYAISVRCASPNWLINGGHGSHTGGSGPGGRPLRAVAPLNVTEYDFTLPIALDRTVNNMLVDVVILDTAPTQKAVDDAVAAERGGKLLADLNREISDSISSEKRLTIDYLPIAPLQINNSSPPHIHIYGHDYNQADHGLFVAGIIHRIAPSARLRLIRVLDDYGVGSMENVVKALQQLANERKTTEGVEATTPLLINCSLMDMTPLHGHPIEEFLDNWPDIPKPERDNPQQLVDLPFEYVCAALRSEHVLIVASAGNDGFAPATDQQQGKARQERAQARNPAAFSTVLGVGALEEASFTPTTYSNTADIPDGAGVATFGGGAGANNVALERQGILGIYIGAIENDPDPEKSGWAWWSGTSFAVPIITGVLAQLATEKGSLALAEDMLRTYLQNTSNMNNIGYPFPVSQGSQGSAVEIPQPGVSTV